MILDSTLNGDFLNSHPISPGFRPGGDNCIRLTRVEGHVDFPVHPLMKRQHH